MLLKTNSFEFEEFVLNVDERTLLRNDEPLSITPKAFHLLQVLLENQGRLVKKEELMQLVWAENFVEEGNLTFTIRLLRKALQDDAQNPRFIKTVPLHGYKFIAEVRKSSAENNFLLPEIKPVENSDSIKHQANFSAFSVFPIFIFLAISSAIIVFWYWQNKTTTADLPILNASFATEKITTDGKTFNAIISPDGKNVLYSLGNRGQQSIWIRELETNKNIEIIPTTEAEYAGLDFSPDGNFFYFSRKSKEEKANIEVFRASIFDRNPVKIIDNTTGKTGISPDGAKISFVRCPRLKEENCSLWIADSLDGKNERKIYSRPIPYRISDNKFSPDGKSIAIATGQSENQANEFGLMEVNIETQEMREISSDKFFNIKSLVWLPADNGWLVTASKIPIWNFRIWHISKEQGKTQALTKDSESYASLSIDRNSKLIVSTQAESDFKLLLHDIENPSRKQILTEAQSATFSPEGKIVFSSEKSGNQEIWASESNGTRQIQLTNNIADDSRPKVSPDNNFIYFSSNRSGEVQIWRMNADGGNQVQITQKNGGFPLAISPDGNVIFYLHGRDRTLWRISNNGSDEQIVFDQKKHFFALSPDCSQVALSETRGEERFLTIHSLNDKTIVKSFPTPVPKSRILEIEWLADGKGILYVLTDNSYENQSLWLQETDKENPRQIVDFKGESTSDASGLSISFDNKYFTIIQGSWQHNATLLKGLK